ncbi:PAS domain-containing sensor histidine kinase [Shewanella sp. JM162201]|uniref:histidine kinase n=1 Tax=Shewanella jiangmenensis TaxID=2837387 RepID=A0ABS5UZW7_9GAMM|nr:ATP-binding protein [Shewanella jiangmenensis]MBT1443051.1 PAS domain-containing sensor histidine kinase [Shewanella jiangmenensis]
MPAKALANISDFPARGRLSALPVSEAAANERLAASPAQMAHILEAMPSGVVILNADGVVTLANPVAVSLLDRPLEGERWLNVIARAFSPRDDDGHEVSLKNGRRVKLAITPLEPGQLIVLTDLTETRVLQRNLAHMQRLSSLGRMVATLAHQIRTPLSAALLYAANLGSPKLNAEARGRFQQKLLGRLNELERQVNDMLLMARGKVETPMEPMTLNELLAPVLASCAPITEAQGSALKLQDESGDAQILASQHALSSAINNLIMNSLEAGAKHVLLHGCVRDNALVLSVVDDGKGLESGTEQQVMEPFFTTKAQGTGLGLAVVQTVVRNHGGDIKMQCAANRGCSVMLKFPLLTQNAGAEVNHG